MSDKKGSLKTKGAEIYFETKGDGESVLFIHAGIADCRMWEREYRALAKYFHVIRFDLPGYGLSSFTGGTFSYIDIINELLDYLEVEKVHIVAASFGAKIAIDYILKEQEKCLSSVLVSPAISGWQESQYLIDYGMEEERLYEDGKLEKVGLHNLKMWVLRDRGNNCVSEDIKELVMDMQMKALTKPEPKIQCEEVEEEEQIARLESINTLLVVIIGSEDVPDFQEMSDLLCKKVISSRKVVIHNTAHLPNLEAPIEFENVLLDYLLDRN